MQPDKGAHMDLSFLFPFEPSILMAETNPHNHFQEDKLGELSSLHVSFSTQTSGHANPILWASDLWYDIHSWRILNICCWIR